MKAMGLWETAPDPHARLQAPAVFEAVHRRDAALRLFASL